MTINNMITTPHGFAQATWTQLGKLQQWSSDIMKFPIDKGIDGFRLDAFSLRQRHYFLIFPNTEKKLYIGTTHGREITWLFQVWKAVNKEVYLVNMTLRSCIRA